MKLTPTVFRVLTGIIIFIYFLLASLGFWYFEPNLFLKIVYFLIIGASIFEFFAISRILGFLLLTLYLSLFTLQNLLYSGRFDLWLVFLITLPVTGAIISLWKTTNRISWKKFDTLLWILVSISLLEGLIVMKFLSFSPYLQAFLILVIPLLAIEISSDYRENKLNLKRVVRLAVIILIAVLIVFISAPKELY